MLKSGLSISSVASIAANQPLGWARETKTFDDLIQLHRDDLRELGKRIGRSKAASLAARRQLVAVVAITLAMAGHLTKYLRSTGHR